MAFIQNISRSLGRIIPHGLHSTNISKVPLIRATSYFCIIHRSNLSTETVPLVNVIKENGFSVVEMNKKPVNSLNMEMCKELTNVIDDLEADTSCQGIILTSALAKIFSAGLDITEFMSKDEARTRQFWESFQNLWLKLYGTKLATVAAVNGTAPAAGCVLAMSCDYIIMTDNTTIGLSETQLGIVAPSWVKDTIVNTVGHRQAEHLLCLGKLLTSAEAKNIGLVDCVVNKDDVISEAKKELQKWLAIPGEARSTTKTMLREPTLEKLRNGREEDTKIFIDFIRKDSTQKILAWYMKKLAEKSKSKV